MMLDVVSLDASRRVVSFALFRLNSRFRSSISLICLMVLTSWSFNVRLIILKLSCNPVISSPRNFLNTLQERHSSVVTAGSFFEVQHRRSVLSQQGTAVSRYDGQPVS